MQQRWPAMDLSRRARPPGRIYETNPRDPTSAADPSRWAAGVLGAANRILCSQISDLIVCT